MSVDQEATAESLTAQITAVNAAISTVGLLQNAPTTVLQTTYATVQSASAQFKAAAAAYDADIDITSVGGVVAGLLAPQLAAALLEQTTDVQQEAQILIAGAYVARVGCNLNNASD